MQRMPTENRSPSIAASQIVADLNSKWEASGGTTRLSFEVPAGAERIYAAWTAEGASSTTAGSSVSSL